MKADYIFYYFTPLVHVVHLTGARLNGKTGLLLVKIMLSAGMMT